MKKLALALISVCLSGTTFASNHAAVIINASDNDMLVTYQVCEYGPGAPTSGDTTCGLVQAQTIKAAKNGQSYLEVATPSPTQANRFVSAFILKAQAQNAGTMMAEGQFKDYRCDASAQFKSAAILNDFHSPFITCQNAPY